MMGFALKPDVCRICGEDASHHALRAERERDTKRQLRKALLLACNGDPDRVNKFMQQASDLLWPLKEAK